MAERSVVVRLRAEIGNFRSDMKQAGKAVTDAAEASKAGSRTIVGAMTQAQDAAAATRKGLFEAGKAAQDSAKGFGLSYNAAGQLTDKFGAMVTAAHAAELGLETSSEATREYAAQTAHAAAETAAAAKATESNVGRMVRSARENEQAWTASGTALLTFGAAAVGGVALAIHKFAEFDKAMSEVRASTHETSANMDLLRDAAVVAGADTAFSAKEAAQGIDELAKAGVSTKDILNGGLTGALSLAAAGGLAVGDAAEIAATALTQFKLSGKDIPHVADLLAAGAGKAQGSVQDMGMALKQAGLVASQTGLSIEETTGGLAAFASAGLIGSDAGTSFKSMLQRLTPQSKEAQKAMDSLGISAYDSQGEFIGLSAFAGQLQNSMKDLDSESRNAAMGVIFGSDAVRAANVLYEQGSTGVQGWIDAVDDAGFAAVTASIKQDNLAGDIEKLGGSFDTVLIKGGEGAAQSLRGIVQSAEGLIDMLGKADPQLLQLGVGLVGAAGGAALLGGGFLTMLPKVLAAREAFKTLQATNSGLASGLGKVGKAAGVAAVALVALSVVGALFGEKDVKTTSDYANAILKVGNAGKAAKASDLDSIFKGWDKFLGSSPAQGIDSVSDAIGRLTNHDWNANVNQFFDGFVSIIPGAAKSELGQIEDRLKGLGDELGNLASNGGAEAAAKSFNLLAGEFEKGGKSAQDALDKMPGYKDALLDLAHATGVDLSAQELLSFAQGKIPQKMLDAQAATEQAAAATADAAKQTEVLSSGLEEIGVSAQGAITNLDTFTQSLVAAGLLTLSSRDAARAYEDTLDSFNETLAKNGKTLDQHTKAGRDNEAAIDAITKAGIANAESIAKDTAAYGSNTEAQAAVQAALKNTYTEMVNAYVAMGKGRTEADALTRATLHIPSNVNIDTWMADTARAKAAETKAALDAIPKNTTIRVNYENTTTNRVNTINSESHIAEGPGGRGGMDAGHADGGAIYGPGTGTSDDIPAWLSNGEHVLTAAEVQKMGGQSAVYRFRGLLDKGLLPAFARGGAVGAQKFAVGGEAGHLGESANARANRLYREAQAAAKAAEDKKAKSVKAAAALTAKRKKEQLAKEKARLKKLADAKAAAAKLAAQQAQYRAEQGADLRLDDSRGQSYQTVTGGLSNAYSFSDKLRTVANSGNVPKSKSALLSMASNADSVMRNLYKQADKLTVSLDKAKDKYNDLLQVKDKVSSSLSGEFSLGDAVKKSAFFGIANVGDIQKSASTKLAAITAFGGKLNQLQKMGYSGAILQEVAGLGSVDGIQAADALLGASKAQVVKLNDTYVGIDKASDAAGTYVTNAMYAGGVNAAQGLVKGLESQQSQIEAQMLKIGLSMETALKKALGIRSPSRKAAAIGDNFTGTLLDRVEAGAKPLAKAAAGLGDAMYVAPSKSMAGGYGRAMTVSAGGSSGFAGAGGVTEVHNHYHIDAKPGLAQQYAKDIADQATTRSRDLNAVYGIGRI